MKVGYPPAVIKTTDRARYYEALDYAHKTGVDEKFVQLVSDSINESLHIWLSII